MRRPGWEGVRNAADLGGLPLVDGGVTAFGRVWRSAATEWMTERGWAEARADGLATVVDLRNGRERGRRRHHPVVNDTARGEVRLVRAPTEDPDDADFLEECGRWLDHPRSWTPNAHRYPEKIALAFGALAASDGPTLVHCAGGRDRTGMVCSMLLALTGVEHDAIADSYEDGFRGAGAHRGHGLAYDPSTAAWVEADDRAPWTARELDRAMADRIPVLLRWLADFDVESYLRDTGLDPETLDRLRTVLPATPRAAARGSGDPADLGLQKAVRPAR